MKRLFLLTMAGALFTIGACKKDKIEAPTAEDAQFTYTTSSESDNILIFTASNSELIAQWDFGNGSTGEGTTVEAQYPQAGSYDVTLTVFNEEGQASSTQTITIAQDDATLLDDPIYNLLTGGISAGSKTWVIDSNNSGHFGVGPNPVGAGGLTPEWWAASCNEKPNTGLYTDQYTFTLQGFGFDMKANGLVYVDDALSASFPGSYENLGDYSAPYDDVLGESWTVTVGEDDTTLSVSGGFMGFYTGVTEYRIVRLSENEMFLRYLDVSDAGLSWYIRLIPVDYDAGTDCDPGGGGTNDSTAYNLPIDFESEDNVFSVFGGSTYQVIDNPDASGINTSSRVLETVHGDQTWAGIFVDLIDPLEFGTNSSIAVKIWAPSTGTLRIKLEDQLNSSTFVEKDVSVTTANEWIEVSIDFAGETSSLYNRIVLFPGWDVANAGTFYLDDISQQ